MLIDIILLVGLEQLPTHVKLVYNMYMSQYLLHSYKGKDAKVFS